MDCGTTRKNQRFFFSLNSSRSFLVDGKPFYIRGVNYDTNPIGGADNNPWYQEFDQLAHDAQDIKDAGFNTVKIYGNATNASQHMAAMDAMLEVYPDLKFMVLDYVGYDTDYSVATGGANRTTKIEEFVDMATIFEGRPEVIWIGFANENNLVGNRSDGTSIADWYSLVNEACGEIKILYPHITTGTVDAEVGTYPGDSALPNVDVIGFNFYRGSSFTDALQDIVGLTTKPCIITEYGIERADNGMSEQNDQATEVLGLLQEAESFKPFIPGWVLFKWSHNHLTSQLYHIAVPLAAGVHQSKEKYAAYTTIKNYLTTTQYGG